MAMKMHAKERDVPQTQAYQQYGVSGRSVFLMLGLPRKKKKEREERNKYTYGVSRKKAA